MTSDLTPHLEAALNVAVDADAEAGQAATEAVPAEPPQPLQVAAHIAGSQSVRERITAYVKMRRWQDPDADVRAPIPLDDLVAAVAADQEISGWISQWFVDAHAEINTQTERACAALPDEHIIRVVVAALERLEG